MSRTGRWQNVLGYGVPAMLGAFVVCVSLLAHKMSRDLDEFLVAPQLCGGPGETVSV